MFNKPQLLVITPISHLSSVKSALEANFTLLLYEESSFHELPNDRTIRFVFVNPNQLQFHLDRSFFDKYLGLEVIATASTGTNHIDKDLALRRGVTILSLTEERSTINRISSTAEHALALTLAATRNIVSSYNDVLAGNWSYTSFIGRQISELTVGVIGYGRLGSLYAHYTDALGSNVLVYDPYVNISHPRIASVPTLEDIAISCEIVSLHVHVTPETVSLIDRAFFAAAKSTLLLVNTSRGEIVDEQALLSFLFANPQSKYATDVLASEYIATTTSNTLKEFSRDNPGRILITPHIAGMTKEGQSIAFSRAAQMLIARVNSNKH
jgi:D-3-phosphoglycerate dehydrogenase / 2-oxoglutarate reductase